MLVGHARSPVSSSVTKCTRSPSIRLAAENVVPKSTTSTGVSGSTMVPPTGRRSSGTGHSVSSMTEFRDQDLTGARFERVSLRGASFSRVFFNDADMHAVHFSGALIHGALFNGTRLRGVELVDVQI